MQAQRTTLYFILILLITAIAPILWGTTYIVTTELLPPDRPFTAAFYRLFPAGIILLLLSRVMPRAHEWKSIVILSLLNFAVFHVCLFIAAYRLPGGLAAVVGAIQPLLMMVIVGWVEHIKPARMALIASVFAVFGMAALLLSPNSVWDAIGIAAALLGAFLMTCGVYLSKRWRSDLPLLAFTGWQLLIAGVFLAPLAWLIDPPIIQLTTNNMLGYGYLTLLGTCLAYALWFYGLSKLSPVAISSLGLLSPISAVIIGWLLLDQSITGFALLGLITVLTSVLCIQWALIPKRNT